MVGDLVDRFNFMAGSFFSSCLCLRSDGTSATMVPGVGIRADREGDSTIRKHAPIRLKSSVVRNYCPKLYVSPCWLRRFERVVLCYHESRTSPPRPPALPPYDGSFVQTTLQSNDRARDSIQAWYKTLCGKLKCPPSNLNDALSVCPVIVYL